MRRDHSQSASGRAPLLARLLAPPVNYGGAVVLFGAALALRLALRSAMGPVLPYLTFYPAVLIAATLFGLRPTLLATLLSSLSVTLWILPAHGLVLPMRPFDALRLVTFCCFGTLVALAAERLRQARARADVEERELAARRTEEVKEAEDEREIAIDLLRTVNQAVGTRETVKAAVGFFQARSGCEAIGLRLREGDDYPYFEVRGFSREFVQLENRLCASDEAGRVLRDGKGAPVFECMCGQLLQGRFDSTKPYFTPNGSFFTGDAQELGAQMAREDWPKRPRGRCTGLGYRSIALVPLRAGGAILGLLQLNDRRPGMFTPARLALWERLAGYLAVALAKSRADEALREANAQLAETDRRKTEFLAVLSHELRNPLTPIRNSLYVLERIPPGSDQAQRAHAVIDRQVTHLTRLVGDLLDVTRITSGKVLLQRERLDLNELVRRTADDHASVLAAAGLQLELEEYPEPVWVSGDQTRLAQVIGNLLQNSAKFTPAGGQAKVSVRVQSDSVLVSVEDTGTGIAPEVLPRLFEPFAQADMALDRSKGGLGLGLALVKGMVELHGGSVRGESNGEGRGATFTIQLPLDPPPEQPAAGRHGDEGVPTRRVLIIEDNADAADSLREVLEMAGHSVEVAYGGAEGIEKAQAFLPEVVLCDIGLPGMSGYEVARRLRADRALREARLIALTGYAQPEDVVKAQEAGFDEHLAKPPDPRALARAICAPVRGRSLRERIASFGS